MTDGFEPATIEARIRAYEGFGIHRSGWPGDDATSDWLVEELGRLGVAAGMPSASRSPASKPVAHASPGEPALETTQTACRCMTAGLPAPAASTASL